MNAPFKNSPTPRSSSRAANAGGAGSPPPVSPATHSNTAERTAKATRDLPPSHSIRSQPVGGDGKATAGDTTKDRGRPLANCDQVRLAHISYGPWSAANVTKIVALRKRGLTYGQIAIRFGVTRCAIAGVIHRHSQGAKGRAAA